MTDRPSKWRPTPFLVASVVLLVVCAIGAVALPRYWLYFVGGAVLNHAILIGSGFVPRSGLLGPNVSRLESVPGGPKTIALTFDDGPDPRVTPAVLEILKRHDAKATFFCVGERAREHPDLIRAIVAAGHGLGNHSWSHTHAFWFLGAKRLAREIDSTQRILQELSGEAPRVFRAPAGIRSPILDPVLAKRGLALVSWTRRGFDTVDGDAERVIRRLLRSVGSGDILLLHDGAAARGPDGTAVVLDVLPKLLKELDCRGLEFADLLTH